MESDTIISNDILTVGIDPFGARVSRIDIPGTHTQWLHNPSGLDTCAPFIDGIQPLFPPGRTAAGHFILDGHSFDWPINDSAGPNNLHGFGWNVPWTVTHAEATGITLMLDNPDTQKQFGAPFSLTVTYNVQGSTLQTHAVMRNTAQIRVPAAFGLHINIALNQGDYTCLFPSMEPWCLDNELVPTGERLPIIPRYTIATHEILEDQPYRIIDDESNDIYLTRIRDTFQAHMYGSNNLRQLVVYRPHPDTNFVSIEPYSWLPNAPNLTLSPDLTGMVALAPGDSVEWTYRIKFDQNPS